MKKFYLTMLLFGCMQARIGAPSQMLIASCAAINFGLTEAMAVIFFKDSSLLPGMASAALAALICKWMLIPEASLKEAMELVKNSKRVRDSFGEKSSINRDDFIQLSIERDRLQEADNLLREARSNYLATKELARECTTGLEDIEIINRDLGELMRQRSFNNK